MEVVNCGKLACRLSELPELRLHRKLRGPGLRPLPCMPEGRAAHLAQLQSDYQEALQAGDPAASVEIAQLIRDYQQSEGVRLKNVPGAYRVS